MKYAFYDFSVSPYSYDFVSFLVAAHALGYEHVVFVPGKRMMRLADGRVVEFQKCTPEEQAARLENILKPLAQTFTVCETREEARKLWSEDCFPPGYTLDRPLAAHVPSVVMQIGRLSPIRPTAEALEAVRATNFGDLVTITVRQSTIEPRRNSNIPAWIEFADELKALGFNPVFIPDTEFQDERFGSHQVSKRASVDVQYRLALYETAVLNMGVNNGPVVLCLLSRRPLLYFKPITEGVYPTSPEFWAKANGIPVGSQPPWFSRDQKIVWDDDRLDVLQRETRGWLQRLQREAA